MVVREAVDGSEMNDRRTTGARTNDDYHTRPRHRLHHHYRRRKTVARPLQHRHQHQPFMNPRERARRYGLGTGTRDGSVHSICQCVRAPSLQHPFGRTHEVERTGLRSFDTPHRYFNGYTRSLAFCAFGCFGVSFSDGVGGNLRFWNRSECYDVLIKVAGSG